MTKKRTLPQTGGQYKRQKNGDPVPKAKAAKPAKAAATKPDQPIEQQGPEKE